MESIINKIHYYVVVYIIYIYIYIKSLYYTSTPISEYRNMQLNSITVMEILNINYFNANMMHTYSVI